jgi:hypothetical protein
VSDRSNLITLPPPPHEAPVKVVVEMLEDMLARAKSGEIRSAAVVAVNADDGVTTAHAGDGRPVTLLGAVHRLSYYLNTLVIG